MNKCIMKKVSCMALLGIMLLSGKALGAYTREEIQSNIELSNVNSLMVDKVLGYGSNYDLRLYRYISIEDVGSTNASWAIVAAKLMEYSSNYLAEVSAKHIDYSTAYNSTSPANTKAHSRNLGSGGSMPVALGYFTSGRGPISKADFEWDGRLNQVALSTLESKKPGTMLESYKIFPSMYKMTYSDGKGGTVTFTYNDPIIYMSADSVSNLPSNPSQGIYPQGGYSYPAGTTFSATKDMISYTGGQVEQVRSEIKEHIIKYGAVSAKIYRNDNSRYMHSYEIETKLYDNGWWESCGEDSCWESNWEPYDENKLYSVPRYYCNIKKQTPTNNVLIIGWDDEINIPGAPGKGAYLVMDPVKVYKEVFSMMTGPYSESEKNSWWGRRQSWLKIDGEWYAALNLSGKNAEKLTVNTNYYYVSYYDYYIESNVYGLKDTTYTKYTHTYEHDPLGLSSSVDSLNYSTIAYGANVFDRTMGRTEVPAESLSAISIASESDMKYEVYVNPKSEDLNEANLIKVATTGVMEAGYNTIYFDSPLMLTGNKFAVAVKYIAVDNNKVSNSVARIGVEAPTQKTYRMLANNKTETIYPGIQYWSGATSNQKQSYIGTSLNDWKDLYTQEGTKNYNICIKAYVVEVPGYKIPAEKIELKKLVQDAFGDTIEETLPETVQILKGDSITLGATVLPEDAADKSVSWTSSNKTVATVDKNGVVTTHAAGIVTITARMTNTPSIYAECKIDVRVPVDSFVLNKSDVTILAGETNVLAAIIGPEDATTTKVEWSSNNKEVVKVTEDGLLIGLKQGSAIVTAVLRDEIGVHTATCKVTVPISLVVNVTGVSLNKTSLKLTKGTRETLTATVTPGDATNTAVVWSSSNKNVAIVNSNGRITALAAGTTTITATTVNGGETATCTVTVVEEEVVKVTGVTINTSSLTLEKDQTRQLIATVMPSNSADTSVIWSSNNLSVAEVNSSGKVTAISPGTAVITVTTADGGYTSKCTVTVKKPAVKVTGIKIDKSFVELDKDKTAQLITEVQPGNADNSQVNWSSSNSQIVKVDEIGQITAVNYGTAVITATTVDGGYTAKCTVSVPEVIPVTGIQISSTELTIEKGITSKLVVKTVPENADNTNITFEVEDEKIATLAGDGVKALAVGQTTITFKTEDGNYTTTCTINVIEPTTEIIISSANYQISEDKEIYGVSKDTNAKDFKNNISTNGTIAEIVDKNGNPIAEDGKVGTGSKLIITKEVTTTPEDGGEPITTTITETYVIKIDGDLNGDGAVSITDFERIRQYLLGKIELEQIELEVADLNRDGKITLTDLSILRSQITVE